MTAHKNLVAICAAATVASWLAASSLHSLIAADPAVKQGDSDDGAASHKREDIFPYRSNREVSRIPNGDEQSAKDYYHDLAQRLGFSGGEVPALDGLLQYFGFTALKAADIDAFTSQELMDLPTLAKRYSAAPQPNEFTSGAQWDLLAAGYFAPKTSDVSNRSHKISWRKMVRLTPRPKSAAEKAGLSAMYFLSVVYVRPQGLDKNPLAPPAHSLSVQVILTADPNQSNQLVDPACWLIFDPARGYKPSYSTTTSWDAADPDLTDGLQPYYLPFACAACHGGAEAATENGAPHFPRATPNFIDTDYCWDKASPGEDFEASIGRSSWAPLLDCGKDFNREQYHAAFDVVRRINSAIVGHNLAVDSKSMQSRGGANWLRLHEKTAMHLPPIARGWPDDKRQWDERREVDRNLLPLLNHYCYRCHGSIRYNVFAKSAIGANGEDIGVLSRVDKMILKIENGVMPQDRELTDDQRNELIGWLKHLKAADNGE